MAKQKELIEGEVTLQKVELECIDKENDLYVAVDLLNDDVIVCEFETINIEHNKAKKKDEIVNIKQERVFTGGFFKDVVVNSEGYSESLKLTIIGKK